MLDVQQTTLALLVLLYLMRRRTGTRTNDLFDQIPPIEQDVIDVLGLEQQDAWFAIAEQLMLKDYGPEHLQHCENCERFTLTPDMGCQACFVYD